MGLMEEVGLGWRWLGCVQQAGLEHGSVPREWLSQVAQEQKGWSRTSGTHLSPSARECAQTKCGSTSQELGLSFSALQKTLFSWLLSALWQPLGTGADLGCSVLGVVEADAAGDPLGRRWCSWWWTQGQSCPPPRECPKVPTSTAIGVTQELFCFSQDQQMLIMSSPPTTVGASHKQHFQIGISCLLSVPPKNTLPDIRKAPGAGGVWDMRKMGA